MKVLLNHQKAASPRTAVALGTFDGLHAGHRAVIQKAIDSPLPSVVFSVEQGSDLLTPLPEKQRLLSLWGVDYHAATALADIQELSPDAFFTDILIKQLNAAEIICGFNFRFGKNAAGDISLLKKLCQKHNVALTVVPAVVSDGTPLSSTRIRRALQEGDPETAERLLGRPFGLTLPVCRGNQLGRTLGFPTVNQPWPTEAVLPKFGVYAVSAMINGVCCPGLCNIGVRPTVGSNGVLCETHFFVPQPELYDRELHVSLLKFIRPEQKFTNAEALKNAVDRDKQTVHSYFDALSAKEE